MRGFSLWGAVVLILAGCRGGSTPPPMNTGDPGAQALPTDDQRFLFTDVTAAVGVTSTYDNGRDAGEYSFAETLGGGVGLVDYNNDGWVDIVLPTGGKFVPNRVISGLPTELWRNLGGGAFTLASRAQLSEATTYTHGVAAADYDSDGFADILITGYAGLQLFHNQGDGTFQDVTAEAGLAETTWSTSAAWGDLDGDGVLDLYVPHYVDWSWDKHPRCLADDSATRDLCSPRDFEGLTDAVYFGTAEGGFRDASRVAQLVEGGKGLGALIADLNDDGQLDVYVANDTTPNFLYLNQGQGVFSEEGLRRGVALDGSGTPNGSMGLALFDYNDDQRLDIWVTNFDNETFGLYRAEGKGDYSYVSEIAGVTNLGRLFVGFGTLAADLDLDGKEELTVANGHVLYHPASKAVQQLPLLLTISSRHLVTPARFSDASYFGQTHWGRGIAAADLDRDGDLDLVFTHLNEPVSLLRNDSPLQGRLLSVRLIGRTSPRDPIGARVTLRLGAGRPDQVRMIVGGGSYLSQSEYQVTFGTPETWSGGELEIHWPSGRRQTLPLAENRESEITVLEPQD